MWCATTGLVKGISVIFADVFPSDRTAGVSSMICTVTNKSKSLTYAVASSFACLSPLAVRNRCWSFWILERFPVQLSSDLSCSACALRLRSLPQIVFHLVSSKDGAVRHQSSEGEMISVVFAGVFLSMELLAYSRRSVPSRINPSR